MFLHASQVVLAHPHSGAILKVEAPLPKDLLGFLSTLDAGEARLAQAL
jgi:hypothetical protein